jgi:hypothetical protein
MSFIYCLLACFAVIFLLAASFVVAAIAGSLLVAILTKVKIYTTKIREERKKKLYTNPHSIQREQRKVQEKKNTVWPKRTKRERRKNKRE